MNTESNPPSLPISRLVNIASITLLAFLVFGLVRLGFGAVPVWILAVPFVLLASLDLEGCFSQPRTFFNRLMVIAFHFVIVGTVFGAHQQLGGSAPHRADLAASSPAWGCAAGGCGASSGAGGKSACGCGSGGGKSSSSSVSGSACGCGSGKATTTTAKPVDKRSVYPPANRTAGKTTVTATLPIPAAQPPDTGAAPRPEVAPTQVIPIPMRPIPAPKPAVPTSEALPKPPSAQSGSQTEVSIIPGK